MSDLEKRMQDIYNRVWQEAMPNVYGSRYTPIKGTEDEEDPETTPDFPYIEDPKGFVTHVPLEQDEIQEAEEEAPQKPMDAGEEAGASAEPPADMPPPEGEEGGIGDMGMDAEGNMPGVEGGAEIPGQQEEEELSSNQLGRVYELKKIYSRLASVESFLSRTTNEEILEIRKMVAQSIDLF